MMPGLTDLAVRSISAMNSVIVCDAEVDPSAEMRIREVAELQVPAGIEAGLLAEGLDGVVVEAGPGVLPAVEVGHPVRECPRRCRRCPWPRSGERASMYCSRQGLA